MNKDRITVSWDWRSKIRNQTTMKNGAKYLVAHPIRFGEKHNSGEATFTDGTVVTFKNLPITYKEIKDDPNPSNIFRCSCRREHPVCRHAIALMLEWEEEFGPFTAHEPEDVWKARVHREELQEKKLPGNHFLPAQDGTAEPYFNLRTALAGFETNAWEEEQAKNPTGDWKKISIGSTDISYVDNKQTLRVTFEKGDPGSHSYYRSYYSSFYLKMQSSEILEIECSCRSCSYSAKGSSYSWYSSNKNKFICSHMLQAINVLYEYLRVNNPGDDTDERAMKLLQALRKEGAVHQEEEETEQEETKPQITIIPQYEWDSGTIALTFLTGEPSGKMRIIKNVSQFCDAVDKKEVYSFTAKSTLDLAAYELDEEGQFWCRVLRRFIRFYNEDNSTSSVYYYRSSSEPLVNKLILKKDRLDMFYDLVQGHQIQYRSDATEKVTVGHIPVSIRLRIEPKMTGENFEGVHITGSMPEILDGKLHQYILKDGWLSQVTREDEAAMAPYRALSSITGTVDCVIGNKQFMDFYYRILPQMEGNPLVELDNQCHGLEGTILPPKAQLVFYLDRAHDLYECRVEVFYGDTSFYLPSGYQESVKLRDSFVESSALKLVRQYFPSEKLASESVEGGDDGQENVPVMTTKDASAETIYELFTVVIPQMQKLGEVQVTEAFSSYRVTPPPKFSFSMSIENDLLDLELLGMDISLEELREIFASYQQKKRFHVLKNGSLVDLTAGTEMKRIEELSSRMHITLEDMLSGKAHIPLYRALYLNQLLEERDDTAYSRDKLVRTIVKSFKTIEDSDFEVPAALKGVLRPYQEYGYKWMRTLSAFGFGGILADDMGLGKTIQMLSVLAAWKAEGETGKTLIVCPASLVYNWKAETERFVPDIHVRTMDGPQAERRAVIQNIESDPETDLYVTSYELLRRDIALYQQVPFRCVVLDEAQFIKTTTAATTKACKVLQARYRFALTGTPIENRLSELWSIFDFLMPGFLYTHKEFKENFENPIMKQQAAEVSSQLAKMTSPFILRRLKQNVLRDLPDKLEETREAIFEDEQQKLYNGQLLHMRGMLMNLTENPQDKIRILAEITKLRQICCDPSLVFEDYKGESAKRAACIDLVKSAIDGGHKVLLFSQFTSMLDLLSQDLREEKIQFYTITGATPKQERIRLVNAFNTDTTPVFLISLKAGGTGLNLTGADVVIHYDPWWNVSAQNQATDRAHRIGQTKVVTVYKLIAAGTIEEKIVKLQESKKELADAILNTEGANLMSMSKEELIALFS